MVEEKLRNADNLLRNAGGNKQQYGFALVAYHGAIEDFFRQELAAEIARLEEGLNGRRSGWGDLIRLWEAKRHLAYEDKKRIQNQNARRQIIGHGAYLEVEQAEAEAYGDFVKYFIKQNSSSRHSYTIPPAPKPEPARPTAVVLPQPVSTKGGSCVKRLATLVVGFVLVIIVYIWTSRSLLNNTIMRDGRALLEVFQEEMDDAEPADAVELFSENDSNKNDPDQTAPTLPATKRSGEDEVTRIRVSGSSNVRSGPGTDFDIVGTAYDAEEFEVIETDENGNWYKIELENGAEGWLGSSRAVKISP
ncbi:MAG: SH3 domain-containing protein [Anaerolineaceae bacterium]|nr:SH3 domain-containing protein [Anaerolineaceae bacterium]